ncbi:hypothetical protein [Occultella kanbiaonis]|uniref:hypothetical protein n=1 Tax=Occultella kanbiaonis TaxID=2675754 RepID=UPI0013D1F27F|nr:hypothetical protein [Occultella kanbiaonis]
MSDLVLGLLIGIPIGALLAFILLDARQNVRSRRSARAAAPYRRTHHTEVRGATSRKAVPVQSPVGHTGAPHKDPHFRWAPAWPPAQPTLAPTSPHAAVPSPPSPSVKPSGSPQPTPRRQEQARIITRTGPHSDAPLYDGFAISGERRWTAAEQVRAVGLYQDGETVNAIARHLRVDQKDVAARLIRILLDPADPIDNDSDMPQVPTNPRYLNW